MTSLRKFAAVLGVTVFSLASYHGLASAQEINGEGKELVMFTITASNV